MVLQPVERLHRPAMNRILLFMHQPKRAIEDIVDIARNPDAGLMRGEACLIHERHRLRMGTAQERRVDARLHKELRSPSSSLARFAGVSLRRLS